MSTGDLFRENLSQGTPLGVQARGYMDAGKLVPDALVIDMLFDRVDREDCAGGYLLDGFPRTVAQAESLAARLGDTQVTVIDLEVSDEVIVGRASGRVLCRGCDAIYHKTFTPPKGDACDACGGELYQRDDDKAEVVAERLVAYHEQTAPVVDWFRERRAVCAVDGTQDPGAVFAACVSCMEEAR